MIYVCAWVSLFHSSILNSFIYRIVFPVCQPECICKIPGAIICKWAYEWENQTKLNQNNLPVVLSFKHLLICRFHVLAYSIVNTFEFISFRSWNIMYKFVRITEKYPCGIWNMQIVLFFHFSLSFLLVAFFHFYFLRTNFDFLLPILLSMFHSFGTYLCCGRRHMVFCIWRMTEPMISKNFFIWLNFHKHILFWTGPGLKTNNSVI